MGSIFTSGLLISLVLCTAIFHGGWTKPSPYEEFTIPRTSSHYDGSRIKSERTAALASTRFSSTNDKGPTSSGKIFLLRRKKGHKNKSVSRSSENHESIPLKSVFSITKSFSIPMISDETATSFNSRYDESIPEVISAQSNWVSNLHHDAFATAYNNQNNYAVPAPKTPIMVDITSQNLRSNIPLPYNPFVSAIQAYPSLSPQYFPQEQQQTPEEEQSEFLQESSHSVDVDINAPNSRADNILSSLSSYLKLAQFPSLSKWTRSKSTSHYTKPGSSSQHRHPNHNSDSVASPSKSELKKSPITSSAASREATFATLLSKLHKVQEMKEAFPPRGSYTPYGERTIIMVKYPGLPERKRVSSTGVNLGSLGQFGGNIYKLGGIRPVSITVDDWGTPSARPIKVKDSDVGVIISQNYILQPDVSMNSNYNFEHNSQDGGHQSSSGGHQSSPTDMVSQLAKALAERNRIINTYSKGKNGGPSKEPPFVLIHLETFTKKNNNTTPFGFDDERETSYANGTIIYPTLDDPSVLASTKFEFEDLQDVENVFDRPLQGYKSGGGMKPIVPLGLVEIQNFLRLLYQVHKDIHEGGRAKVGELQGLSHTIERTPLPGSRPMASWELERSLGRYKENWLHTSTIGLRSISDYPPPPPKLPIPYPTYL